LVPGALMHLSSRREVSLPNKQLDGLAIVLGEAGKGKRKGSGYNVLFNGEVITFYAASTATKLVLSARINPELPDIYYTFKPILLAGAPHDRQQRQDHQDYHTGSSR
jgi:hypothetical protein